MNLSLKILVSILLVRFLSKFNIDKIENIFCVILVYSQCFIHKMHEKFLTG